MTSTKTAEQRLAERQKFLNTPAADMVDAGAIKRREMWDAGLKGALKWGGYTAAGLAVAAIGTVAIFGLPALVGIPLLGWFVGATLGGTALTLAGIVGGAGLIGGISAAGQAAAESDVKVQAEIDKIARAQERVRYRELDMQDMKLTQQGLQIQTMRGQVPQMGPGRGGMGHV